MIEEELNNLNTMSLVELKKLFLRYFNYHPPLRAKDFYVNHIAYRMQELEFGGLSAATKELLAKMYVKDSKPKKQMIAPVGTKIIKNYKGKDYVIRVLDNGYDLDGQYFKTLSSIAKKITGMKISGNVFLGLKQKGKR